MNRQLNFRPGVFLSSSCARPYQLLFLALVQPLPAGWQIRCWADHPNHPLAWHNDAALTSVGFRRIHRSRHGMSRKWLLCVTAKGDVPYRSIHCPYSTYIMFIPNCVSIKDLVFQRCTHCLSSLRLQFLPTLNFAILYLTFSRSGVGTKMPSGRSCHVGSGRCAGSLIYSNIIQH